MPHAIWQGSATGILQPSIGPRNKERDPMHGELWKPSANRAEYVQFDCGFRPFFTDEVFILYGPHLRNSSYGVPDPLPYLRSGSAS